jgi:hypothetical protein
MRRFGPLSNGKREGDDGDMPRIRAELVERCLKRERN